MSKRKLRANRRNASKSTGPVTDAWKARSSMNRLKSGIYAGTLLLPTEDPEKFKRTIAEYHDFHQPQSPEARALCDRLARAEWFSNRYAQIENALIVHGFAHVSDGQLEVASPDHVLAEAYLFAYRGLGRLNTRQNAVDRGYQRDLDQLREIEMDDEALPAAEEQPVEAADPAPEVAADPELRAQPTENTEDPVNDDSNPPDSPTYQPVRFFKMSQELADLVFNEKYPPDQQK